MIAPAAASLRRRFHVAARTRCALQRVVRQRCALLIALVACGAAAAQAGSQDAMQGLDDQVQDIKSDVLAIATELQQLEEKLLYPSDTQVAVFVSLGEGEMLELDSAHLSIDGAPVAHHVYEFKELEALRKGGVQRLYTGNVPTGAHRIEVSLAGKLPGGADFDETEVFEFRKDIEPKIIDLTLMGRVVGGLEIAFGDE